MSGMAVTATAGGAIVMTDALFWDANGVPSDFARKSYAVPGLSRAVFASRGNDVGLWGFKQACGKHKFRGWDDFKDQLPAIWRGFDAIVAADQAEPNAPKTISAQQLIVGWSERLRRPEVLFRSRHGQYGFLPGATYAMNLGHVWFGPSSQYLPPPSEFTPDLHGVAAFEAERGVLRDLSGGLEVAAPLAHSIGGWIDIATVTAEGVEFRPGVKVWPDTIGQPIKPNFVDVFRAQQTLYKAHEARQVAPSSASAAA